jgi:hypothetical protein
MGRPAEKTVGAMLRHSGLAIANTLLIGGAWAASAYASDPGNSKLFTVGRYLELQRPRAHPSNLTCN